MNCVSLTEQNGGTILWRHGERGIRGKQWHRQIKNVENVSSRAAGGVQVGGGERGCENLFLC